MIDDLTFFLQQANINRVLLFPPVESRYRFLIHKTVEDFPTLTSFSIGEGNGRQTVVCLESSLQRTQKGQEMLMSSPQSRESLHGQRGRGRGRFGANSTPSPTCHGVQIVTEPFGSEPVAKGIGADAHGVKQPSPRPAGKGRARARKPEMQLYIPRGRRDHEHTDNQHIEPVSRSNDTEHTSAQDVPDSWESLDMDTCSSTIEPKVTRSENQWTQIVENSQIESGQMKTKKGNRSGKNSIHKGDEGSGVPASSKRGRPHVQLYVPRGRRKMQKDEPHDKLDSQIQLPQAASEQMDASEDNLSLCNKIVMGATEAISKHETPQADSSQRPVQRRLQAADGFGHSSKSKNQSECDAAVCSAVHQMTAATEGKDAESVRSASPCDDWYQEFELSDQDLAFQQAAVNVERTQNNACADSNSVGRDTVNMSELYQLSDISYSASLGCVPCVEGGDTGSPQNCPSLSEKVPEKCRSESSSASLKDTAVNNSSTDDHPSSDELRLSSWESNAGVPCTHSASHDTDCISAVHKSSATCADICTTDKSQMEVERVESDYKNKAVEANIVVWEPEPVDPTLPCTVDICCESGRDVKDQGTNEPELKDDFVHISENQANNAAKYSSHSLQGGECEKSFAASCSEYDESFSASCIGDRQASGVPAPGDAGDMVPASTDNDVIHLDETPEVVKNVPEMADKTPAVVTQFSEMAEAVTDAAKISDSTDQAMAGYGKEEDAEEEDSWDNIYDDNGDCLDPSVMAELTAHVGEVKISKPKKINYLDYQPKETDMDMAAYSHVIEISDFPVEFQTPDLLTAFRDYMSRGFDIKWVDDTHALGVFSSTIAAQDALKLAHPMMKLRPLSDASKQSRNKARRCQEFLQPYKARPETTAAAARRLVAGALGMTTRISKEQRDQERKQLKEAREKKKLDRKQKDAIWDGTFGKCAMDQDG